MRTTGWIRVAVLGALVAVTLGTSRPASGTAIIGGTPEQQSMARWAVGRFEAAGLWLPALEIHFHADRSGCRGRLGYYLKGEAHVCGTHTGLMAHRLVLHEMAHGWAEYNLSSVERARFLELRGLRTWKDHSAEWHERGTEHAAEIMSWARCDQGTGINTPSIPDNSIEQVTDAYELLTGNPLPEVSRRLS
jgi:hypothetical protein